MLKPKAAVPHKLKVAAVVFGDQTVLLTQRPASGLLGGLWEFPSAEVAADSPEALVAALETEYRLKVRPLARLTEVRHAYTHFKLTEVPWRCELVEKTANETLTWIPLAKLTDYPMGKVDRTIARQLSEFTDM